MILACDVTPCVRLVSRGVQGAAGRVPQPPVYPYDVQRSSFIACIYISTHSLIKMTTLGYCCTRTHPSRTSRYRIAGIRRSFLIGRRKFHLGFLCTNMNKNGKEGPCWILVLILYLCLVVIPSFSSRRS